MERSELADMDLFSEILQTVKLRGTIYFHARFCSPWGMDIPKGEYANYHIVTSGSCWLKTSAYQESPILLQKGDMVLFPRGAAHTLSDSTASTAVPADEMIKNSRRNIDDEIILGGEGTGNTRLICGHFEHNNKFFNHPLFATLPSFIHIAADEMGENGWFSSMSELAANVSRSENAGKNAIVDRLAESLFIQALTEYMESLDDPSIFLAAAQDKHIGMALNAIHADITHDWNLTELANIALMSQSAFSVKFLKLVKISPMVYLAHWRMLKATEMLSETTLQISQISERVGYQSVFSFSKAFKKMTGETPGSVRKSIQSV